MLITFTIKIGITIPITAAATTLSTTVVLIPLRLQLLSIMITVAMIRTTMTADYDSHCKHDYVTKTTARIFTAIG